MGKVRTGIVGYGKVAHTHAEALQALPESALVAVCGRNSGRAQAFAVQYGIDPYTDLRAMIAHSGVEAIVVCTPHPAHADPVLVAAGAGAHALVKSRWPPA